MLRRQYELDRLTELGTADPRLHDILRIGAYQLRALRRVPAYAAVSTTVELAREVAGEHASRYVNQVLRRLARGAGPGEREPGDENREAGETHPRWLLERWRKHFGSAETKRLVAWNDAKPRLTLQPARWSKEALARALHEGGFGVEEAPYGAGLRVMRADAVSRSPLPARLPGYAEGGFVVQDPAHTLVCRYAGLAPGTLVYDACAAPGGKSVVLERLGARVVAADARRDRVGRLVDTVRRAGVAIRVVVADLLAAPLAAAGMDAVLVDAPCTATGTMARHPDARWRLSPSAIVRAAARQRRLLEAAARAVQRGGALVYATCSLEPEENSDVVNAFLGRHPEFGREPVAGGVPGEVLTPQGDLQSLPQRHGIDGAYAARLVRAR